MAPTGAKIKPYRATKSSNFMAKAGNKPAVVAIAPATIVTQKVDFFGKNV